ncbi:MAG: hypothetical protein V7723_07570 [Sneathiella sp.]|uniref:hypothetical protein n=1 Tax=Sneathiella sp. TaxID=1964365 RepID=UPI00300241C8
MPKKTQGFDEEGHAKWFEGDVLPVGFTRDDPTAAEAGEEPEDQDDPEKQEEETEDEGSEDTEPTMTEDEARARAAFLASFSYDDAMKTKTKDDLAAYAKSYGYELDAEQTRKEMMTALSAQYEAETTDEDE